MDTRNKGTFYEKAVADYLSRQGIRIVTNNYRCRLGEIDLIGEDENTLIFFEVKFRRNDKYGSPFDAIDYKKQKRIINAAKFYLMSYPTDKYIRFDAVGITDNSIEWIKDAFCQ